MSISDDLRRLGLDGAPADGGALVSAASLAALADRMDELRRAAGEAAAAVADTARRDLIYAAYHRISSTVEPKAAAAVEGATAKQVWEGGGDGGFEHKKSHSHWRESRVFADRFAKWGQRCLAQAKRHPRFDARRADLVIAEYGPGGGAVLSAFAPHAARCIGFDIAESNLAETARVLAETGRPFTGVLVPENFAEIEKIEGEIDLFLSFNVFQHLPSKAYLRDVVAYMARAMKPGAPGVVDIRFDNGDPKFAGAALEAYGTVTGHTFATSIRIDHFNTMLEKAGFVVEFLGALSTANGATFWITRR